LHTNILEEYTASTFKVKVRKDGKLWLEDQARRSCQSESGRRRGDGAELAPMGEQDSVIRDNRKEGWVK
jgi:hypothetical protein